MFNSSLFTIIRFGVLQFELALQELWGFAVVLVRTSGILSTLPIIGGRLVPMRIKVALAGAIALVMAPIVTVKLTPDWLAPVNLLVGLTTELFIGLTLGLATRLLMAAVEMAGSVMGFQVGFGVASVLDPVSQVEIPVFGQFLTILTALLYFQVDGHHLVLLALRASFGLIPPFGAHLTEPLFVDIVQLVQTTLNTAMKLALPVMGATFLVHLTLGILGRMVPQMNILITSFPVTISLGLLVLGLGLPLIALVFQQAILGMEGVLWELLRELGRG